MKKGKLPFRLGRSGWSILLFVLLGLFIYLGMPGYQFSALIAFGVAGLILCFRLLGCLERRAPRTGKWLRRILTVCILLGLAAAAVTGVFITRAGYGDKDTDCQYIIVLGAGVDGTRPSLSLRERLDAAYGYLTDHPEAICIVSGGQGGGEEISEAACMFADLTRRGISETRIWQEDAATNTRENLAYSLALIQARTGDKPKTVGIVSSEYHLYRAGLFAREQGLRCVGIPGKTSWISLRINYFLREIVAVWYYTLLGG